MPLMPAAAIAVPERFAVEVLRVARYRFPWSSGSPVPGVVQDYGLVAGRRILEEAPDGFKGLSEVGILQHPYIVETANRMILEYLAQPFDVGQGGSELAQLRIRRTHRCR